MAQKTAKTGSKKAAPSDDLKRGQILDAAFYCFLQYGYSKTSLDDVAKKAGISRPAIYLKFKNKSDLFHALYVDLVESGFNKAEELLKQNISKKEKLIRLCESTILEPWSKIAEQPRAGEFYALCEQIAPEEAEHIHRQKVKIVGNILEDKEAADIFLMAQEGFYADLPSTNTLRKRIYFLIDRFLD